jgi:hypothetical protein
MKKVSFAMDILNAGEAAGTGAPDPKDDPVLALLGVGSQLWEFESGDRFVDRLRSGDAPVPTRGRQELRKRLTQTRR